MLSKGRNGVIFTEKKTVCQAVQGLTDPSLSWILPPLRKKSSRRFTPFGHVFYAHFWTTAEILCGYMKAFGEQICELDAIRLSDYWVKTKKFYKRDYFSYKASSLQSCNALPASLKTTSYANYCVWTFWKTRHLFNHTVCSETMAAIFRWKGRITIVVKQCSRSYAG